MLTFTDTRLFIFYINYYDCITQWSLKHCTVFIKSLYYTLHISRRISVENAKNLLSKGFWLEPTVRPYFSSNNVHMLAYVFTG